jgi:tetratricopeptide (TPR) repeat protein
MLPAAAIPKAVTSAVEALEQGHDEQAEALVRQVLQTDPNHRQALSLLKQIKEDPATLYSRESFAYRVASGDSLSSIAKRFLGDAYQFYGLARYNSIKVPRQLAVGQTIRVPGKAPSAVAPPSAAPTPTPATTPATTQAVPPPVPASAVAPAPPASVPDPAVVAARAAAAKADAIARLTREATSAFNKQDLDGAIRTWDKLLAIEPNHRTAILERQKAVGLREKLKKVPR